MEVHVNQAEPTVIHIDLNSCFATVEQQANPLLRGKPMVVAAYATDYGCVLAPSMEAKRLGIKTGMRVKEAKLFCPSLIVKAPDPSKYRYVYKRFCKLFRQYTPSVNPKSIDEAVLHLGGTPVLKRMAIADIGAEIKRRMRSEIGEWLFANVGIATNGFLAKTAAGLHKPDGLDIITHKNLRQTLTTLAVEDLCGINKHNKRRLATGHIFSPVEFLDASLPTLKAVFGGIGGYYWYLRLRGWEIDDIKFQRRTVGHSFHLTKHTADVNEISRLLYKLCEKMGRRLRRHKLGAQGVHLSLFYKDGTYWNHGHKTQERLYTSRELFERARNILLSQPEPKVVRVLAVNCFSLFDWQPEQPSLFQDWERTVALTKALDQVNNRWGDFTIIPGTIMGMDDVVLDRIAFGQAGIN